LPFYALFYNSWNVTERKIKAGIYRKKERKTKVRGAQARSFMKDGWGIREMFQWKYYRVV